MPSSTARSTSSRKPSVAPRSTTVATLPSAAPWRSTTQCAPPISWTSICRPGPGGGGVGVVGGWSWVGRWAGERFKGRQQARSLSCCSSRCATARQVLERVRVQQQAIRGSQAPSTHSYMACSANVARCQLGQLCLCAETQHYQLAACSKHKCTQAETDTMCRCCLSPLLLLALGWRVDGGSRRCRQQAACSSTQRHTHMPARGGCLMALLLAASCRASMLCCKLEMQLAASNMQRTTRTMHAVHVCCATMLLTASCSSCAFEEKPGTCSWRRAASAHSTLATMQPSSRTHAKQRASSWQLTRKKFRPCARCVQAQM